MTESTEQRINRLHATFGKFALENSQGLDATKIVDICSLYILALREDHTHIFITLEKHFQDSDAVTKFLHHLDQNITHRTIDIENISVWMGFVQGEVTGQKLSEIITALKSVLFDWYGSLSRAYTLVKKPDIPITEANGGKTLTA